MDTERNRITRRDLLKRGAVIGGAALWTTPVVQVVGMGRAYAKDVSPGCTRYCLKWEVDDNNETGGLTCANDSAQPIWTNNWEELGRRTASGKGTILLCPEDGINDGNAANDLANRAGYEFVVYGSSATGYWVAFPSDVTIADLGDQPEPWSAAVKCGQGNKKFTKSDLGTQDDPCETDPNGKPYRRVFIPDCGNGKDISHVELIVDWCPGSTE